MKTLKKGGLVVTLKPGSGDKNLQDELAEASSLAKKIIDKHGGRGLFRKFNAARSVDDDAVELLYADVLKVTPALISNGLAALPAEYRPQVDALLYAAVNLGRALEGMDVYIRSIESLTKKPVTEIERKAVLDLNEKLKPAHPKKAPRYREIIKQAKDLGLDDGRVRYIVEGPRRPSRKRKKE